MDGEGAPIKMVENFSPKFPIPAQILNSKKDGLGKNGIGGCWGGKKGEEKEMEE